MNDWKIGELARLTGLTVRTLHHYDRIGLISPSKHTNSGHRLYTETDLAKLQQIMSLKQLGFALEEIKRLIENPSYDPREVIRIQLKRLSEQIRLQQQLYDRLEDLNGLLGSRRNVSAEQFVHVIEMMMKMTQNEHFSREHLEKLKEQRRLLGPERTHRLESEWTELIAEFREECDRGTPPDSPEVQRMAVRWKDLIDLLTGGDAEIVRASERYYQENPDQAEESGIDKQLYAYINKAMAAAQL